MSFSRNIKDLDPKMADLVRVFLTESQIKGLDLVVYCTLRTFSAQARLYRQGRTLKEIMVKAAELRDKWGRPDLAKVLTDVGPQFGKSIVTHAGPGQSLHNYGLAVDCVILRDGKPVWDTTQPNNLDLWRRYGDVGKQCGLEWGGDWTPSKRDYDHLQYPGASWEEKIHERTSE